MSLFIKVFTNFYTHRKTMRLRTILGDDAFWIPPRLWAYAAENQPDGDFSSYTDGELAGLLGYSKDATSMLQALLQAGFLDENHRIHDWEEYNGYHKTYAERAKQAASARWERKKEPKKEELREDRIGDDRIGDKHCFKHACSIPVSASGRKPASVEEVITKGQFVGVSEQDCRDWFRDCEACNWCRGDGTPFDNWPRQLVIHRDQLRSKQTYGTNSQHSPKGSIASAGTSNAGRAADYANYSRRMAEKDRNV